MIAHLLITCTLMSSCFLPAHPLSFVPHYATEVLPSTATTRAISVEHGQAGWWGREEIFLSGNVVTRRQIRRNSSTSLSMLKNTKSGETPSVAPLRVGNMEECTGNGVNMQKDKKRNGIAQKDKSDQPENATTPSPVRRKVTSKQRIKNGRAKKVLNDTESKPKSLEPHFWCNGTDNFVIFQTRTTDGKPIGVEDLHINGVNAASNSSNCWNEPRTSFSTSSSKYIKFTVRGKPVPLSRHRTSRGYMYNPSARKQEAFRQVVLNMLPSEWAVSLAKDRNAESEKTPFFADGEHLIMAITFRLRRPKSHFIGGKPGPGRLRPTSPGKLHPTRTDVDNLSKFVLDSLNGLLYVDDRQIVSLHATKVFDTEGHCEGATDVFIRSCTEKDIDTLLNSQWK